MLAIREGVSLALQWSNLPIDIESDCLEAVSMLVRSGSNLSKYSFMMKEIKQSMGEQDSSITHIRCNGNCASHSMANFARAQGRTTVWLGSAPSVVIDIVLRDCNP